MQNIEERNTDVTESANQAVVKPFAEPEVEKVLESEVETEPAEPSPFNPESPGKLKAVLDKHGISLSVSKVNKLAKYCDLLWIWNEKMNLTRHTDFERFVSRDLIDSINIAESLAKGERILDVGTGGGVPGIILAIIRPDLTVELCDSTGKKANAVTEIVKSLKMRLPVWHEKAEDLLKRRRYTTLVVRAVAKMKKLLETFAPHWHSFKRILMLKGPNWVAERGESRHFGLLNNLALRVLKAYKVSEETGESVLLQVCQKNKLATLEKELQEAEKWEIEPQSIKRQLLKPRIKPKSKSQTPRTAGSNPNGSVKNSVNNKTVDGSKRGAKSSTKRKSTTQKTSSVK
ncbi:MAG: 16S rRNA (guanine(527)-N(7))-methyltransferase RsmG, partial [Thermoguttaceae bacterium]